MQWTELCVKWNSFQRKICCLLWCQTCGFGGPAFISAEVEFTTDFQSLVFLLLWVCSFKHQPRAQEALTHLWGVGKEVRRQGEGLGPFSFQNTLQERGILPDSSCPAWLPVAFHSPGRLKWLCLTPEGGRVWDTVQLGKGPFQPLSLSFFGATPGVVFWHPYFFP